MMMRRQVTPADLPLQKKRAYDGYVSGLCPFHPDRNPSLLAYDSGWFRCMSCGTEGPLWELLEKLRGGNPSMVHTATVDNTQRSGALYVPYSKLEDVVYESHEAMMQFPSMQWYPKLRGVASRIESNQLGWRKGWIVVPSLNRNYEVTGATFRATPSIQEHTGLRFAYPVGQKPTLFVPDWRRFENAKSITVVLGTFTALALATIGIPTCTVAGGGKQTFDASWLDPYRVPIYVIPDAGEEGTALKIASLLGWRGNVLHLPYTDTLMDAADFLQHGKREQLEKEFTRYEW